MNKGHQNMILILFMSLLTMISAHGLTLGFEGVPNGEQVDEALENISVNGVNSTDSVATINYSFANSGVASLYLYDNSQFNKPMVLFDFKEGRAHSGSIQLYCYIPEGNRKSTYLALGVGKDSSDRYVEIKISGLGTIKYENGDDDPEVGTVSIGIWHHFELKWADGSFSYLIDGKLVISDTKVLDEGNIPSMFLLYVGDTRTWQSEAYFDDISSDLF